MSKFRAAWEKVADLPGICTLMNRDVRYLELDGAPLYASATETVLRSPQFKSALAAALIVLPYTIAQGNYKAAYACAFAIGVEFLYQNADLLDQKGQAENYFGESACIDKKGHFRVVTGNETPDLAGAKEIMKDTMVGVLWLCLVTGIAAVVEFPGVNKAAILTTILIPTTIPQASSLYRWANVRSGKWAIIPAPPMDEVKQEARQAVPGAAPQPT